MGSSPCAGVNPPLLLPLAALTGNKAAVLRARLNLLDMVAGGKRTNICMSADFRHLQSLQLNQLLISITKITVNQGNMIGWSSGRDRIIT